jgi:pilus assembly protein Flp/PilA
MKMMKRLRGETKGQGLTEYIIIVALIAIAAIGVVTLFGDNIRKLFGGAANSLSGDTNVTPETSAAKSHHKDVRTLKTFGQMQEGR